MFPVHWKEAVLMSLGNESSFHYEPLSKAKLEQKLKVEGDFLFHRAEYDDTLILSVRKDDIHDFFIFLKKSPSTNFTFCIGELEFPSYDSLVDYLKLNGYKDEDGDVFQFSKAVACTTGCPGRFGAEFERHMRPRSLLTDPSMDLELKVPCRLVALRKEISAMELYYELRSLSKLSHENLVSLLDYEIYGCDPINRLVILRNQSFAHNLSDYLRYRASVPLSLTCKYIRQAADAMYYLDEVKAYSTIVCGQDSYVDPHGNLKIGGAWTGRWPTIHEDSVKSTIYWRFCSPDFLIWHESSRVTLMYNWAVFAWQIATSCLLQPFSEFTTAYEYLDDRYYLHLPLPFIDQPRKSCKEELKEVRTIVNLCNRLPDPLNRIIANTIDQMLEEKLDWDRLVTICQEEQDSITQASTMQGLIAA